MSVDNNKYEAEILISGLAFPESPLFDAKGNLWFVEIQGGNLSCWNGKELHRFYVDGTPNGIVADDVGRFWFCDSRRGEIRTFNPIEEIFETVCHRNIDGQRLCRPNDLIFDYNGNLIFSDHADGRVEPLSTICVLPKGRNEAKTISRKKKFTNGLALWKDGKTLLFAETYNQAIWMATWDSYELELNNERYFARAGHAPWGPDGMALDEYENLFVAMFNEGKINVYSPEGILIDCLFCVGNRPTSCAFDPLERYGLVVTEAQLGEIVSFRLSNQLMA